MHGDLFTSATTTIVLQCQQTSVHTGHTFIFQSNYTAKLAYNTKF